MNRLRYIVPASIALAFLLIASSLVEAAFLQRIESFGSNPTNAKMYLYVPDEVASFPAILVGLHWCSGSADAFFTGTRYRDLSDQHGFIVIYPEVPDGNTDKCWDVNSDASLMHDGNGDSQGIVSMVKYTVSEYGADANRVYVTGVSSGAMMTNVLLGAYPDVFKGGAAFAGVPYGCFAGSGYWNSTCANGEAIKTGQQWGDLVRAAYPGYNGYRPRMQLWHGTDDQTLNFNNFGEEIKQWTNVLGVSETPTMTEQNQPQSGWTRTYYADSCGVARVEAVKEQGQPHNLTVLESEVIRFFGLSANDSDPGIDGCGGNIGSEGGADGGGDLGAGGVAGTDFNEVDGGGGIADSGGNTDGGSDSGTGGVAGAGFGPVAGGGAGTVTDDGGIAVGPSSTNTGGTSNAAGWTPTIETNTVDNADTVSGADPDAAAVASNPESSGCGCRIAGPQSAPTSAALFFGLAFALSVSRFRRRRCI